MIRMKRRGSFEKLTSDALSAFLDVEGNACVAITELDLKKRPAWRPVRLTSPQLYQASPWDLLVCTSGAIGAKVVLPALDSSMAGIEIAVLTQEAVPVVSAINTTINNVAAHTPTSARRTIYVAGDKEWFTDA